MKITKICLENFLSYGQRCDINLQDISFLVGPNGSGKTNLLKAIITMGKVLAGQGKDIDLGAYSYDQSKPFSIELEIKLSDQEKHALCYWLTASYAGENGLNPLALDITQFSKFLAQYGPTLFSPYPGISKISLESAPYNQHPFKLTYQLEWGGNVYNYDPMKGLIGTLTSGPLVGLSTLVANQLVQYGYSFSPGNVEISGSPTSFNLPQLISNTLSSHQAIILPVINQQFIMGPGYENVRAAHWFIYLVKFLQERGWGIFNTRFEDMVAVIFNSSIIYLDQWRGLPPTDIELRQTTDVTPQYIGELAGALSPLPLPRKLTAEVVMHTIFELYTSESYEDKEKFSKIESNMCRLTGFKPRVSVFRKEDRYPKSVPITSSPEAPKSGQETIKISKYAYRVVFDQEGGKRTFRSDDMAAGDMETMFILTAITGLSDKIALLDEPGLNLHPPRQRELADILAEAFDSNQMIISTHSSHLISPKNLGRVIRTGKTSQGTEFHILPNKFDLKVLKTLSKNQALIESLFARSAILCEGDAEYFVAEISLPKALGAESLGEKEIVAINCGSDTSINRYSEILTSFGTPFYILCDRKALNRVNAEYKGKCTSFPDDDTYRYLEKSNEKEFEEARKSNGSSKEKDNVVLREVLYKIEPPKEITELAEKIEPTPTNP
jgi:predicted ATPase